MRTVEFGEIKCSVLGFGCAGVMGRVGRRDSLLAMEAAWDAEITLFDTARSYGYGEAEGLLGEFLRGRREQATVVTKFGIVPAQQRAWKRWAKPVVRAALRVAPELRDLVRQGIVGQMSPSHFDVATLRTSLETSLRELRTDYVDALLAHGAPSSLMEQEDLMAELEKIVREGKALRAGISSTGRDTAIVALRGPAWISVLQYPAWGISDWPQGHWEDRFWMANHPFGGVEHARSVAKLLASMAEDARIKPALREKLRGDSKQRLAEFWFGRARLRSRPHAIVTSMLKLEHVRANATAIDSDRFSADDLTVIERWISAADLLQ